MKVIEPGHVYQLSWLDGQPDGERGRNDILTFVKREGTMYPRNVGHHPGTTMQEVLRAMIERIQYVDAQVSDVANVWVLANLRQSIWQLEHRAARRHGRILDPALSITAIELVPTCPKCLHIGCEGACHP